LVFQKNPFPGSAADYRPTHVCSGTLDQSVDLKSINLSRDMLKKGVECVAGDFDGNGSLDFALFQPPDLPNVLVYRSALVVFFDGPKIKMISRLDNPPPQLCRAGSQCFCMSEINQHDALEQTGGGDYDRSANYDVTTGKWTHLQCGGEDDSVE
jgi:hypothetical protein